MLKLTFAQSTPCGCDRAMRNKKGRVRVPRGLPRGKSPEAMDNRACPAV